MKIYVLCSYGNGLNDPVVSADYQEFSRIIVLYGTVASSCCIMCIGRGDD